MNYKIPRLSEIAEEDMTMKNVSGLWSFIDLHQSDH
jgi:hypothetical protein